LGCAEITAITVSGQKPENIQTHDVFLLVMVEELSIQSVMQREAAEMLVEPARF
jgi:hypothetical protein